MKDIKQLQAKHLLEMWFELQGVSKDHRPRLSAKFLREAGILRSKATAVVPNPEIPDHLIGNAALLIPLAETNLYSRAKKVLTQDENLHFVGQLLTQYADKKSISALEGLGGKSANDTTSMLEELNLGAIGSAYNHPISIHSRLRLPLTKAIAHAALRDIFNIPLYCTVPNYAEEVKRVQLERQKARQDSPFRPK